MGAMKRHAFERMLNGVEQSGEAQQSACRADVGDGRCVTLPKCRHCGKRKFRLWFAFDAHCYDVLATCERCGNSWIVSLDDAHEAVTRAKKRRKRKRS